MVSKLKKFFAATLSCLLLVATSGCSVSSVSKDKQNIKSSEVNVNHQENLQKTDIEEIVLSKIEAVHRIQEVAENAGDNTPEVKEVQKEVKTASAPAKTKTSTKTSKTTVASRNTSSTKSKTATASKTTTTSKNTTTASSAKTSSSSGAQALDWWSEAQYAFPRGAVAKVIDVNTGKSFNIKRTYGTNHADCEALTYNDSQIIKDIWGGWSWARRPVVLVVNGKRIAASMAAMPHAGLDKYPALQVVDNRSGNYGTGQNLDEVKGNGMDGHFDVHFLNSRTHGTNKVDSKHQAAIKQATGK